MMPESLSEKVEALLHGVPLSALSRAAADLMALYRIPGKKRALAGEAEHLAYIAYRMPATYQVLTHIFSAIRAYDSAFSPQSLLDLGAGPGTATVACEHFFESAPSATLVEQDRTFCSIGKNLCGGEWIESSIENVAIARTFGLVVASYVCSEMDDAARQYTIEKAWQATDGYCVIVEPGTPDGYRTILSIRDQLLALGAHLIAPCPHSHLCPLSGGKWCHFSARVARSRMHRLIKGGDLGWEDEKFSYVVFSRKPISNPCPRIIGAPKKHSGFLEFELCCPDGLVHAQKITKKEGSRFKLAKKAEWGDILAT